MRLYGIDQSGWKIPLEIKQNNSKSKQSLQVPIYGEFDTNANDYEVATRLNKLPKIIRTGVPSKGWIAVLSGRGLYVEGTQGTVYVLNEYAQNVKVVACSYGAYANAKYITSWLDYLTIVKEPAIFLICPVGGMGAGKLERYFLVFRDNTVTQIRRKDVEIAEKKLNIQLGDPINLIYHKLSYRDDNIIELSELLRRE